MPDSPSPRSSPTAGEIAAGQVASIVEAAEQAGIEIIAGAERDAREREREAEREAVRLKKEAQSEAAQLKQEAQAEAIQIGEIARKEADERIKGAQEAADEALAQAQAIGAGLRQLAASLEGQAEHILRDVQAGHRRLMEDLRVGSGSEPRPTRRRTEDRPATGSAIDDLEVPDWAERG
jgi:dsDNA-specific endonuclease/ATPase MutS2